MVEVKFVKDSAPHLMDLDRGMSPYPNALAAESRKLYCECSALSSALFDYLPFKLL